MSEGRATGHIRTLTGLRFLAAAGVVGVHLDYWLGATGPIHAVLRNGSVGVTFFFVLSGFVLMSGYRQEPRRMFYRRRFARIWPLVGVTWTASLVVFKTMPVKEYIAGLVLLQGYGPAFGHHSRLNHPMWSLTCEAFFYALFPFLAVPVQRVTDLRRAVVLCWVVDAVTMCLLLPFGFGGALLGVYLPPLRLAEFVAGMLLALLVRSGWGPSRSLALPALALASSLLWWHPQLMVMQVVVFPVVVVLIAWGATANGWLASRPMVLLGKQSYALYLSHVLVWFALFPYVNASAAHRLTVVVPAMLLVAAALHHLLEAPLERCLRGSRRSRTEAGAEVP